MKKPCEMERSERAYQVRQMLTNQRLEGIEADEADKVLFQGYIDGTVNLSDLMQHAKAYAEWIRRPRDITKTVSMLSKQEILELHRQAVAAVNAKE